LDVIERQTQQIAQLVDDLVDLARLSVNKLKLSPDRLDFTAFLGSVEKATQPIVDAAGQTSPLPFRQNLSLFMEMKLALNKSSLTFSKTRSNITPHPAGSG
jgi:signal transduction histidine kinase